MAMAAAAPNTGAWEDRVKEASVVFDLPVRSPSHQAASEGSPKSPTGYFQSSPNAMSKEAAVEDPSDPREARRRQGAVGWKLERGVPDVGGLGWRTRQNHLLKNQTYFGGLPNENLWNNPTHAGPKTWRTYHGPKLRAGADLMEHMDRRDGEAEEEDAKKAFVNTTRVRTLDKFYQKRIENEQKEKAGSWAPHRRARREVHQAFDTCQADLNSMPPKELKKVMTETVLERDRAAITQISKRIQEEEGWKAQWKQMEKARHDDIRADLELRTQYNDMLMQISGQHVQRSHRKANRQANRRTEELAVPLQHRPVGDITQLADFQGLVHVSNQHALESLFPGVGHEMVDDLKQEATRAARASAIDAGGGREQRSREAPRKSSVSDLTMTKRRSTTWEEGMGMGHVQSGSVPVSQAKLSKVATRTDALEFARRGSMQFQASAAPPAPNQNDQLLLETLATSSLQMSQQFSARSHMTSDDSPRSRKSIIDVAPPTRSMVYPVVVEAQEGRQSKQTWGARRSSVVDGGPARAAAGTSPRMMAAGFQQLTPRRIDQWPPPGSQAVSINVRSVTGLPEAEEHGLGEKAFAVCRIPGKPPAQAVTRSCIFNDGYEWGQEVVVRGWKLGDELEVAVCDEYSDTKLAVTRLQSSKFYPDGFDGRLVMERCRTKVEGRTVEQASGAEVFVDLRIGVQDVIETGPRGTAPELLRREALSMGVAPNTCSVVHDLDDFEVNMRAMPVVGNFWMTPRAGSRGGRKQNTQPAPADRAAGQATVPASSSPEPAGSAPVPADAGE